MGAEEQEGSLPESMFPTTNLSIRKMYGLIDNGTYISIRELQIVANEAIKQYVLDTEAGK